MQTTQEVQSTITNQLEKAPTGIRGLDEILNGGLPRGRTTLVTGGPGCGKTLLGTEFLVRGAVEFNEPGVFIAFEETPDELEKNVASLGIDLKGLIEEKKIFVDYVYIERSEIEETGIYDLDGLFLRLEDAIQQVGAKRIVLDTLEVLFAGFSNEAILRSELRRLFRWMKDKQVTAIVTGERGESSLTRYGLEEYVSDCVILLENRVSNKISNRILRVLKYRGSSHGSDEYPFIIGDHGIWVMPITSSGLNYITSTEHISSGNPRLDSILDGKGFYRGSSILISGTAGTGKTSIAATFVNSACKAGEKCLYLAFEESPHQIIRNMRSIGIDLQPWVDKNLLRFMAHRPSMFGIETHLLTIQQEVETYQPTNLIVDPLTNLIEIGSDAEVKSMLVRLIDYLKMHHITTMFTSLTSGGNNEVSSEVGVSSLMDTWILVRNIEEYGERNRTLYVLKSRGMAHSSQVREFILTNNGIELIDVYLGDGNVLFGSARVAWENKMLAETQNHQRTLERKKVEFERKRKLALAQITALESEIKNDEEDLKRLQKEEKQRTQSIQEEMQKMAALRRADQD